MKSVVQALAVALLVSTVGGVASAQQNLNAGDQSIAPRKMTIVVERIQPMDEGVIRIHYVGNNGASLIIRDASTFDGGSYAKLEASETNSSAVTVIVRGSQITDVK